MTIEIVNLAQYWYFETKLSIVVAMIDRDTLFGASLGACIVTSRRGNLKGWRFPG